MRLMIPVQPSAHVRTRTLNCVSRMSVLVLLLVAASCNPVNRPMEDPVASFVRQVMQPGSAAFYIPSPIHRGEPVEAVLQIGAPSTSPEEMRRKLQELAGRPGVGASDAIRIAPRMTAMLVTDRESTIALKDP